MCLILWALLKFSLYHCFDQFDYDVLWYHFLHICCTQDLLSFSNQWVYSIWKSCSHYFFKDIFCPSTFRGSSCTYIWPLAVVSQFTDALFTLEDSFFSVCLILDRFYSYVFKVNHLFFYNVRVITNPIYCVFYFWCCSFFSGSSIFIFCAPTFKPIEYSHNHCFIILLC